MASDEIVIKYRADVTALTADFNKIITSQQEILDLSKQQNETTQKSVNSLEFAQKKRLELLEQEKKKLDNLIKQRALAFDPKLIEEFNSAILSSQRNIQNLAGEFQTSANSIQGLLVDIGSAIAVAFSAKAIANFASDAIYNFVAAQQSIDKLRFSVIELGGETEAAFEGLKKQSIELAKTSGFTINQIQASQAQLKAFGLTADEIEKLLPLLTDYAKFSGIDLAQSVNQVGNALQGNAKALGQVGVQVDATKTKAENYKATIEGLALFTGYASENSEGLAGQLLAEQKAYTAIQYQIGQQLTPAYIQLIKIKAQVIKALGDLLLLYTQNSAIVKTAAAVLVFYVASTQKLINAKLASIAITIKEIFTQGKLNTIFRNSAAGATLLASRTLALRVAQSQASIASKTLQIANIGLTASFRALSAAIAANPFGALLTALTLVLPYIIDFAAATDDASESSYELLNAQKETAGVLQETANKYKGVEQEVVTLQNAIAKAQPGSKTQIDLVKQLNEKLGSNIKLGKDQEETIKNVAAAVEKYLPILRAQIQLEANRNRLVKVEEEIQNIDQQRIPLLEKANKLVAEYNKKVDEIRKRQQQEVTTFERGDYGESVRIKKLINTEEQKNAAIKEAEKQLQADLEKIGATGLTKRLQAAKKTQAALFAQQEGFLLSLTELQQAATEGAVTATDDTAKKINDLLRQILGEIEKAKDALSIEEIKNRQVQTYAEGVQQINDLSNQARIAIDKEIKAKEEDAKANKTWSKEIEAAYKILRDERVKAVDFAEQLELDKFEREFIRSLEDIATEADDIGLTQALVIKANEVQDSLDTYEKAIDTLNNAVGEKNRQAAVEQANDALKIYNKRLREEEALKATQLKNDFDKAKRNLDRELENKTITTEEYNKKLKNLDDQLTNDITNNNNTYNKKVQDNSKKTTDTITTNNKKTREEQIQDLKNTVDQFNQVFDAILNLSNVITQVRIDNINKVLDAELTAIDESLKANEEAFRLGLKTEKEKLNFEKQQQKRKEQLQEEAAAKEKALKRQQALQDRAAALFKIAIATAVNIAEKPALAGLYVALAALQSAAILAQPLPYRKGSKNTGSKDHLARVGEEGEELVFMPSNSKVLPAKQTKRYGEIIDAMFDNNLDKYIYKKYITPALESKRNSYDKKKQNNFATSIAKEFYFNGGITATDLEVVRKKGQVIKNVDEIANAISKKLPKLDPYRL